MAFMEKALATAWHSAFSITIKFSAYAFPTSNDSCPSGTEPANYSQYLFVIPVFRLGYNKFNCNLGCWIKYVSTWISNRRSGSC
jgi:hypothetical protein